MKTTTTSTTRTLFLIATLTLISVIGYGTLFVLIRGIAREAVGFAEDITFQTSRDERLGSAEEVVRTTQEQRVSLEEHFVEEDALVSFIASVETLGSETAVSVVVSSVGEVEGEHGGSLILELSAEGTWHDVIRFVGLLETQNIATTITELELLAITEVERAGAWRAVLVMHAPQSVGLEQ